MRNSAKQALALEGCFVRFEPYDEELKTAAGAALNKEGAPNRGDRASGARRVELLTDARNARSQAAIAKLGAVREGVLRRDRMTWTGHVRDGVLFAITDLDWPDVRTRLVYRLASMDVRASTSPRDQRV